jgi:uncharacterized protein YbjT (DUF2867 family)
MRIAVVGGTGLVGSKLVDALAGHDVVVLSRSRGVDTVAGIGLAEALEGVEAVVDSSSTNVTDADASRAFFGTSTENLLAAERRAGVGHHIVLSIVNLDRVVGNAHYAGKRRQEELTEGGDVPFTILRATQFFEFADLVMGWLRDGDTVTLPPLLLQPVAASDVADVLAEIAVGPAQGRAPDLGGPETQDFVDMSRRILAARGDTSTRIVPSWQGGPFGVEMAGEVMLPGPGARLGPTTFEAWLARTEG